MRLLDLFCGAGKCYNKSWVLSHASIAVESRNHGGKHDDSVLHPARIVLCGQQQRHGNAANAVSLLAFKALLTLIVNIAHKHVQRSQSKKRRLPSTCVTLDTWTTFVKSVSSRILECGERSIGLSARRLSICWVDGA